MSNTEREQTFSEMMSILKKIKDNITQLEDERRIAENTLWKEYQELIKNSPQIAKLTEDALQWTNLLNTTCLELFPISSVFKALGVDEYYVVLRNSNATIEARYVRLNEAGKRKSVSNTRLSLSAQYIPITDIDSIPDAKLRAKVRKEVAKLRVDILSGD